MFPEGKDRMCLVHSSILSISFSVLQVECPQEILSEGINSTYVERIVPYQQYCLRNSSGDLIHTLTPANPPTPVSYSFFFLRQLKIV